MKVEHANGHFKLHLVKWASDLVGDKELVLKCCYFVW